VRSEELGRRNFYTFAKTNEMSIQYPLRNRLFFYWSYFISKTVLLWFEVKKPKMAMFIQEMRYSLNKLINSRSMAPSPFAIEYVETINGKFNVRSHTTDMSIVSPAYERCDMRHLAELLQWLTSRSRKILVLDIGAHIGAFTIMVGNRFRGYKDLYIMAFEPDTEKYQLLEKNIACNDLKENVESYNVYLSAEDGELGPQDLQRERREKFISYPSSFRESRSKMVSRTLDSLIGNRARDYDAIVMKIDTEGTECKILRGGSRLLESGAEIHLMVEDFIDQEIADFLEKCGAEFIVKLSPYNSWWKGKGLRVKSEK